MNTTQKLFLMALLSFTVTTVVYPFVLRYALRHHVVDNPDARKIHRQPVPVMGGVAVFAGIFAGCVAMTLLVSGASIWWAVMASTIMLVMGVWDDAKNLPAVPRLVLQICVVGAYIAFTGHFLGNLHGLFGLYEINPWIGISLSVLGGVGIINAINMIDGIDGYSSGFGIIACSCFAVLFVLVGQRVWSALAVIVAASLLPFFMHNVFGVKSKMFIGDGGTMMLGFLMTVFALGAAGFRSAAWVEAHNIGMIAFAMAVLGIPVFDTVRVMMARMMRGRSPFKPDKSHLHHLFIDMGFSHLGAAMAILAINFSFVMLWLLLWLAGASVDVQTWAVGLTGLLVTAGFYKLMRWQQHSGPIGEDGLQQGGPLWRAFCRVGRWSHFERGRAWLFLQKFVDRRFSLWIK